MRRARPVLVTGAGGFIGTWLIPHLLDGGYHVVGLGRRRPRGGPGGGDVEFIECDLAASPERVAAAVERVGPGTVIHLAGPVPARGGADEWVLLETSARAAQHLFSACARCSPRPGIVLASSGAVYGGCAAGDSISERRPLTPTTRYAVGKVMVEMLAVRAALADRLPVVRARLFNVVGPGQTGDLVAPAFARQVAEIEADGGGGEIRVGNLSCHRDFVDVRDVAAALRTLVERGCAGGVYNVCSGKATRVGKLLEILLSLADLKGPVQIRERAVGPELIPYQRGNPRKLQRASWRARYTLRRTLADVLEQWRSSVRAR